MSNREVAVKLRGPGEKADLCVASDGSERPMFNEHVMEDICEKENLLAALKRVKRNKGSAGVDGMSVEELPVHLKQNWPVIKALLLSGEYVPQAVRRVDIPKPGKPKEKRKLGIPSVIDRFIQQAILQVLQRRWDSTFSENSYGFRPGRSAHQAIAKAQEYVCAGNEIVVDIDLAAFFDRVNHDRLMSRLAKDIEDKRLLRLIRRYLQAGILENGLITVPTRGSPQGGPLSPFLSNVVLDEWDKELEARGHCFVRYGDDSQLFVKSHRAGERVMASATRFITERLKLRVNESKSAVDVPSNRQFLGFTLTAGRHKHRRKIAPKSLLRFKAKVRRLTNRHWGISMDERIDRLSKYLRGWRSYFGFAQATTVLRDLDSWVRRRLRCAQWSQWKTYNRRKAELHRLGVPYRLAQLTAWSAKGAWTVCHSPAVQLALPSRYFDDAGLPKLYAG